jgi:hypothetical protein
MDSTASTPHTAPTPEVPLTVSDQQTSALLDETLALLSHGLPPQKGDHPQTEIERWETVLASSERPGLAKITQELGLLREALGDKDANPHDVAEILASLGAETAKVADEADGAYSAPLANLSKLLIKAANSLSR